jgi:rhamnose utilization protein RhaD (predicted bifunctional aldolase and dehydrogenase)
MAPSKAFDVTAQFEIPFYLGIIEDPKTVNDCERGSGHPDHFVRFKFKIGFMSNSKDNRIGIPQGVFNRRSHTKITEMFLIAEKT